MRWPSIGTEGDGDIGGMALDDLPGICTPYTLASCIHITSVRVLATSVVETFSPFHLKVEFQIKLFYVLVYHIIMFV